MWALPFLLVPLAACGADDAFSTYCDEVKAQQQPITEALAAGPSAGLLTALPSFEKLKAKAPSDIADEWGVVVQRITTLQKALEDAAVDPATYDVKNPPARLAPEAQAAIAAAADGLGTVEMQAALAGVEQEARDVCKTPLSL